MDLISLNDELSVMQTTATFLRTVLRNLCASEDIQVSADNTDVVVTLPAMLARFVGQQLTDAYPYTNTMKTINARCTFGAHEFTGWSTVVSPRVEPFWVVGTESRYCVRTFCPYFEMRVADTAVRHG